VLPLVSGTSVVVAAPTTPAMRGMLVGADSVATVERVRTFLARQHPGLAGSGFDNAPQTFDEVAQVRAALYTKAQNVMLFVIATTLLVAGCSLAIAAGGGIVERRRPFTLLRVGGTTTRVLRRVVVLESVLPLAVATVVAALTGFAAAIPVNNLLSPATAIALPGRGYYLTMGAGLAVSLAVILATLPLLNRLTRPEQVRFE
jgi:predicted lysophospholipase L1 biosynthesis ABC-type transport system permease subunit